MSVILTLLALLALSLPVHEWEAPYNPTELLTEFSRLYGADPAEVLRVARCESRLDPGAVNPRSGATGLGQWLPGRGNHWDRTWLWREHRIDVIALYRAGDVDAPWFDAAGLAWSFGTEAQALYPGNKRGWSCY